MRKPFLALTLGLALTGCSSDILNQFDQAALNAEQIAFVEEHVETTLVAEDELGEVALAASYGELDLQGASYDPPTEANGWVGTITRNGAFSFGEGAMTMRFTATGDGVEVDPYAPGFDPEAFNQLVMDSEITFLGEDRNGLPLKIVGDLVQTSVPGAGDLITTTANGEFEINHGEYVTMLELDDVTFEMDRVSQEFQSVTGDLTGRIDIPGFATDAVFDIEAQGTSLLVSVDAALTRLEIPVELF